MWGRSRRGQKKFFWGLFWVFLKQPPLTLLPVWQPCKSRYLNFDCQVVESVTAGIYCVKSNFLGWFLVGFWQEWNKTPDKVVIFSKKGRNSGKKGQKKFWKVLFRCKMGRQSDLAHQNPRFFPSSWSFLSFEFGQHLANFWSGNPVGQKFKNPRIKFFQFHEAHVPSEWRFSNSILKWCFGRKKNTWKTRCSRKRHLKKGGVTRRKRVEKKSEKYYSDVKWVDKVVQPIRTHDFFHLHGHFWDFRIWPTFGRLLVWQQCLGKVSNWISAPSTIWHGASAV